MRASAEEERERGGDGDIRTRSLCDEVSLHVALFTLKTSGLVPNLKVGGEMRVRVGE